MAPFPQIAGTASSLLGFIQMGLAAVVTIGVGHLLVDSPAPLGASMVACSLLAVALSGRVMRRHAPAGGAAVSATPSTATITKE
jgi:DHA1 family bicyclomycin/chloramphenicol resistance-like MFS transporter